MAKEKRDGFTLVDWFFFAATALLGFYLIGASIQFGLGQDRVFQFKHDHHGETGDITMQVRPVKYFNLSEDGSDKARGRTISKVGDKTFTIKLAGDEKSFFRLVALCQHELRHVEFRLADRDLSYEEEELLIGQGIEDKDWRYSMTVQLLNFRPKCYEVAGRTVTGL